MVGEIHNECPVCRASSWARVDRSAGRVDEGYALVACLECRVKFVAGKWPLTVEDMIWEDWRRLRSCHESGWLLVGDGEACPFAWAKEGFDGEQ